MTYLGAIFFSVLLSWLESVSLRAIQHRFEQSDIIEIVRIQAFNISIFHHILLFYKHAIVRKKLTVFLSVYCWKDKRNGSFLSTVHPACLFSTIIFWKLNCICWHLSVSKCHLDVTYLTRDYAIHYRVLSIFTLHCVNL